MGKINILDFQVANLIAAGEVVDRPASVVKELIENAIDAGASEIEIEIRRGGVGRMRVTDNGCGMSKDDAEVCILRHATSKIKNERDLDGIVTLGFRGEALAAISSVSVMKIVTRKKEQPEGTAIYCDCGRITEVSTVPCKMGTTVGVEELFANVPARRKFLKRDQSEGMAVSAVVEKAALSHPEISFKLITDGAVRLQTAGDKKLYNVIYALLGRDFASKLIEVRGKSEAVEVFGYIGRPDNVRANRNYQNFFINGRYIKSRTATAALEQAFSSFMESERFPCCVLNIVIHPSLVDVNVHPTKLEEKVSSEKTVFDAVYLAVRNALLSDTTRPGLQLEKKDVDHRAIGTYNRFTPVYDRLDGDTAPRQQGIFSTPAKSDPSPAPKKEQERSVPAVPFDDLPFVFEDVVRAHEQKLNEENVQKQDEGSFGERTVTSGFEGQLQTKTGESDAKSGSFGEETKKPLDMPVMPELSLPIIEPIPTKTESRDKPVFVAADATGREQDAVPTVQREPVAAVKQQLPEKEEPREDETFTYLGIAFDTYILIEKGDTLLMIDKHAAHERLLFEEMKKNRASAEKYTQLLMIPLSVDVSDVELATILDYEEELTSTGYLFERDGEERRFLLSGIPGGLERDQAELLFMTMVTRLADGEGTAGLTREIAFEKALYTASCKAAMKGGRKDGKEHLIYLCKKLLELPDIRYCPHGRPVAFEIPKGKIEHRFGRS
ncbi:MAG: DNA mismatch repair endonuclease MutL [Clostridia bacterium]|nr:DNA mismatch repair endonuclease MutL [Clostridia bacterium]